MSATAVEKITHLPNEPRGPVRQNPSPRKRHLLRWSLVALIAGGIVLTVLLGLVQKFLWMRELDYAGIFWTLLSVKWGMFGVASVCALLYLGINLRFAARSVSISRVARALPQGCHFLSLRRGCRCLFRCRQKNQHRFKPEGTGVGHRCGRHVRLVDICSWSFESMGHLSPLSLRRIVRSGRPALWGRPWLLLLPPSILRATAE
jgi:hypothetical protein